MSVKWEGTLDPDGDAVTYNLVIAKDSSFTEEIYRKEEIEDITTYVDEAAALEDLTDYYWKVEAVDTFGAITSSSQSWRFYTDNTNGFVGFVAGVVYNASNFSRIKNAIVIMENNNVTSSSSQGHYLLSHRAGTYDVTVTIDGYEDLSGSVTVKELGVTTFNAAMIPERANFNLDIDGILCTAS